MKLRLSVLVTVPGVPANWSQHRGHSQAREAEKRPWRELAWRLGHSARNEAGWPPLDRVPPSQRWLVVTVYKRRPLYDQDGCVSALKPVIDGLVGVLLVDDSPKWCCWTAMPEQRLVEDERAERVEIEVWAADPRPALARAAAR